MRTKYGEIPSHQIHSTKLYLRKQIFYLLLYADPQETINFQNVDLDEAFRHVFHQLLGFNKILLEPPELLIVMNYLEAALDIYDGGEFDFETYRKLVLDAGSKIMDVKEGDAYGDYP